MVRTYIAQNVFSLFGNDFAQTVFVKERAAVSFEHTETTVFKIHVLAELFAERAADVFVFSQCVIVNVDFPALTAGVIASVGGALKMHKIIGSNQFHILMVSPLSVTSTIRTLSSPDLLGE